MSYLVGAIFLVVGVSMVVFARPMARFGISFYFSDHDLAAGLESRSGRVVLVMTTIRVANTIVDLLAIYIGVSAPARVHAAHHRQHRQSRRQVQLQRLQHAHLRRDGCNTARV